MLFEFTFSSFVFGVQKFCHLIKVNLSHFIMILVQCIRDGKHKQSWDVVMVFVVVCGSFELDTVVFNPIVLFQVF